MFCLLIEVVQQIFKCAGQGSAENREQECGGGLIFSLPVPVGRKSTLREK